MGAKWLLSFLIFGILACNGSKTVNKNNQTDNMVQSVSLHHTSEMRDAKLTLFPTKYTMETNGEVFTHELDNIKWTALNVILQKLNVQELDKYQAPEEEGRFVERNLNSQISVQTAEGIFVSQKFNNEKTPEDLKELYDYLNSYFPLY